MQFNAGSDVYFNYLRTLMSLAQPGPEERQRAREIIAAAGWNATAYQILNRGMQLWFAHAGDAVAGYVTVGRTRVVAGAPVCSESRLEAVADEFESDAAAARGTVVYFGAGSRLKEIRAASPHHSSLQIGAQPVWDPGKWHTIVASKSSLRAQFNRARNKGVEVREYPAGDAGSLGLASVLGEWLSTRGLPPMTFMVETDLLGDLADRRLFVAQRDGRVDAFLIGTPVPSRNGWLVEMWPRRSSAVNGTTHLLVDAAMRGFADSGSNYATLGLVPLSGAAGQVADGQPVWLRVMLKWLRAHGARFYNFSGLEAFKTSMLPPIWEPIHIIAPGPHFSPFVLRTVGGAFSHGSPELLLIKGLAAAAGSEIGRVLHWPQRGI